METSRTIYSQSDRLSRYTHRIDQLLNKSKSKSKSPYRCRTPKINKQGPMVSRINTYIKYEHSFFVLNKIIQFKEKQLMSDFFILLKFPSKRQHKIKPATKFVVVKEPAPPAQSKILANRLINLFKGLLKSAFSLIKQISYQNKISLERSIAEQKTRVNNRSKNIKLVIGVLGNYLNRLFKNRQMSALTSIVKSGNKKKKSAYLLCQHLGKLPIKNKRLAWRQLLQNSRVCNVYTDKLKSFVHNFVNSIKRKIVKIGRNYSIIQLKKPKRQDVEAIQYLTLNSLVSVFDKARKLQLLSAFQKMAQFSHNKKLQAMAANNRSMRSNSSMKSPRSRRFPRQCDKFRRLVQVVRARQLKTYDQAFQALFLNRFYAQQFYVNNYILNKLLLNKAFKNIKQHSSNLKKQQKIRTSLPRLIKIIESKMKIIRCNTFWNIYSESVLIGYQQMEPPVHKCAHGFSHVLTKLYKNRIVQSYLLIKRLANQYSQIPTHINQDNSSIFIYDDMASFLQQRQGAFEQLKSNYDKIKAMVGIEGTSEITSTSFQSIRAIHQIKNRLLNKYE